MLTFTEYNHYVEENRLAKLAGVGAMAVNSLFGDFPADWSKYYQGTNNPEKEYRARQVVSADFTVPADAQAAIDVGADIFAGDEGKSREQIAEYLRLTGAVESGYRHKVQVGGGPARSYWQVEPLTAMSLVRHSGAYFGKKFRARYGMDALRKLRGLDETQWADALEKYDELGAIMSAAKWLSTPW
jgi:hypothetical protein